MWVAQSRGFQRRTRQGQRSCAGMPRPETQRLAGAVGVLACYLPQASRVRTL